MSFTCSGSLLLVACLVHRVVALLGLLRELRPLEGLRQRRGILLDGLLLAHLVGLLRKGSAGRWGGSAPQRLLISPSSKASYFVTLTSPPWRKKVTNLNSVRTARAAFLMASFTPGYTRSEAEIFPMVFKEARWAPMVAISWVVSSSWRSSSERFSLCSVRYWAFSGGSFFWTFCSVSRVLMLRSTSSSVFSSAFRVLQGNEALLAPRVVSHLQERLRARHGAEDLGVDLLRRAQAPADDLRPLALAQDHLVRVDVGMHDSVRHHHVFARRPRARAR